MTATTSNTTQYFNLTAKGVGFVNRITKLSTKGNPVSITFNASYGNRDDKNRTRFELYVKGSDALKIFQNLELLDKDVMTGAFEIGDIHPDILQDAKSGEYIKTKDGQLIPVIRGNLLKINSLKLKRNDKTTAIVERVEDSVATSTDLSASEVNSQPVNQSPAQAETDQTVAA